MKQLKFALALILSLALLAGCSSASSYVKEHYPLVDVQGKGKDAARIYLAEGRTVPEVAADLAKEEKPKETSKENSDQMFLVYDDKIVNLQKDPSDAQNTLVELDSIPYAKEHYGSSFLEGYLTASLLQSLFGGGWSSRAPPVEYRGYGSSSDYKSSSPKATTADKSKNGAPATTERSGSFSTKSGSASTGGKSSTSDKSSASGSTSTSSGASSSSSSTSGSTGSYSTKKSDSSTTRKSDGSTPTYKQPASASKPKTSTGSGSFSTKRK